jgi:hypothetical protein
MSNKGSWVNIPNRRNSNNDGGNPTLELMDALLLYRLISFES